MREGEREREREREREDRRGINEEGEDGRTDGQWDFKKASTALPPLLLLLLLLLRCCDLGVRQRPRCSAAVAASEGVGERASGRGRTRVVVYVVE